MGAPAGVAPGRAPRPGRNRCSTPDAPRRPPRAGIAPLGPPRSSSPLTRWQQGDTNPLSVIDNPLATRGVVVRNRRWRGMAAALVVISSMVVVSACGSSGSGSSSATGEAAAAAQSSTNASSASGGGTASALLPASIKQRGYINVAGPDASPPLSEA